MSVVKVMVNKDVINMRQLMAMAFVSVMSSILHRLPEASVSISGVPASWLAPLAAAVPILIIAWVMNRLVRNRNDGDGLINVFMNILGTRLGKLLSLLYAIWSILYAGLILRSGAERFLSTVYGGQSLSVFIVVGLVIAVIGATGRLTSLASSAEIFVLFLAGMFLIVFGFSIYSINPENLLSISVLDAVPVMRASIPVIYTVAPFVYLYFLAGGVRKSEKALGTTVRWLISILIIVLLLLVATIGTFGVNLTGVIQSAFFSMARNISIFGTVERIESLVVVIWVAADFVMVASMIMVACEIVSVVFEASERRALVIPCGIAVLLAACFCAPNAFALEIIFDSVVPVVTIALIYAVMPLVLIIGWIRKKV